MLRTNSILGDTAMQSVLASESILKPSGHKEKRGVFADLLLTALIDAFSILVIFLLMSFSSTGEILQMSKDMELPKSVQAAQLERNTVVRIESDKMFLEDQEMPNVESLLGALIEMSKKLRADNPSPDFEPIVTVQADRRLKYKDLNNIVLAAAQAGFGDIRFAVVLK